MKNNEEINPEVITLAKKLVANDIASFGIHTIKVRSVTEKTSNVFKTILTIGDGYRYSSCSVMHQCDTKVNSVVSALNHLIAQGTLTGIEFFVNIGKKTKREQIVHEKVTVDEKPIDEQPVDDVDGVDEKTKNKKTTYSDISDYGIRLSKLITDLITS